MCVVYVCWYLFVSTLAYAFVSCSNLYIYNILWFCCYDVDDMVDEYNNCDDG